MQSVYDELTRKGQARYNGIRRKMQFFATFAGGVIEALRESGFRLCSFEKQPEHYDVVTEEDSVEERATKRRGNDNIELFFEQQDRDQCKVLIVPYRTDLAFLAKDRYIAQLGLELSRYCNDPDTLRQAMAINAKAAFGSFLGGARLPKLYLDSPPDIKPPGTMTFELRGARLVVSMNVLANLGKYRLSDFELDIDAIREDLQVYFYGLEKYLALLLKGFGAPVESAEEPSAASGVTPGQATHGSGPVLPPPMGGAPVPQALPRGGTVPLESTHVPLAGAPLPPRPPGPSPTGTMPLGPPANAE